MRKRRVRGSSRFLPRYELTTDAGIAFAHALQSTLQQRNIMHAHTSLESARLAHEAARCRGVPFVYELRGFWDYTGEAENMSAMGTLTLADWRAQSNGWAKRADAVITLGLAMRGELIRRGIDPSRIYLVENAVDIEKFRPPKAKDAAVKDRLRLQDRFVVGYVTNVRRMEGVDVLLRAIQVLLRKGVPVSFVLVGDGQHLPVLRQLADDMGITDQVRFTGRVPHNEVLDYYSVFDVFVVPRLNLPVCQLVTPMKPLEALALQLPVVVSDVPALRELVQDGKTGFSFVAEDHEDLARVLQLLHQNCDLRMRVAEQGRAWVEAERTWARMAGKTEELYRALLPECSINGSNVSAR